MTIELIKDIKCAQHLITGQLLASCSYLILPGTLKIESLANNP